MSNPLGTRINREVAHLKQAALLSPSLHPELKVQDRGLHSQIHLEWRTQREGHREAATIHAPVELVIHTSPFLHDLDGLQRAIDSLPTETHPPNLHHALAFGTKAKRMNLADGAVVYAVSDSKGPDASGRLVTHFFDANTQKIGQLAIPTAQTATIAKKARAPSGTSDEQERSRENDSLEGIFKDHPLSAPLVEHIYDGKIT